MTVAESALQKARKTWEVLDLHISDGAGYIYDEFAAECVACGGKAGNIKTVSHEAGCFTADRERLIATLTPPTVEAGKETV